MVCERFAGVKRRTCRFRSYRKPGAKCRTQFGKGIILVVRSSKTVTVRGELVEPLVARQYWPSTNSGRTVYL